MISVKKYPHIIVKETMKSADHLAAAESLSDCLIFSTIFLLFFDVCFFEETNIVNLHHLSGKTSTVFHLSGCLNILYL